MTIFRAFCRRMPERLREQVYGERFGFFQFNNSDAGDAAQRRDSIHKPAGLAGFEIDLGDVAGDDHFGSAPQARQNLSI
jgi:DUF1365 family protein